MAKWRKVKLADVCKFVRGPFGGSLKKDIFVSQGYAVFEQQHAIYGDFNKFRYFVTKDKFNEMQRFKLSPGDLIMSCSGTLGKVALVPEGIPNGIINQALLKLTPTDEVEGSYIKSWFESDLFTQSLRQNSGGAAIQNVAEVRLLKEIEIPLPPLAEQRKIAEILRTWDEAIETAEAELKGKQERKRGLMQELLTSAIKAKEVSGHRSVNIGDICNPQQWATIGQSQMTASGVPVYGANSFIGFFSEPNHENDVIAVSCRGSCGEVALVRGPSYVTGNSMCLDYVDGELVDLQWLYQCLKLRGFRDIVSGSAQPQIIRKDIVKVKLLLPPLREQKEVAEILVSADDEIVLIGQHIEFLRTQKRGLMQKLLNGEVRVAA